MTQQELGVLGEDLAVTFLAKKGFTILTRNYRFGHLEIDVICQKDDLLVVVEVKTRQTAEIGEPWRAVTKSKQRQLIKATEHYIFENNILSETRFDVISIVHNSHRTVVEHIEDAFCAIAY